MTCAPSEDSDPLEHPPSLIIVFAVRLEKPWIRWAHSEEADQTGWLPRLISVFAKRKCRFLVLSCGGSGRITTTATATTTDQCFYYCDCYCGWAQMSFNWFCRATAQDALQQQLLLLLLILILLLLILLQSNASKIAISTCQEITSDLTLQRDATCIYRCHGNSMPCRISYTGLLVLVFLGMVENCILWYHCQSATVLVNG